MEPAQAMPHPDEHGLLQFLPLGEPRLFVMNGAELIAAQAEHMMCIHKQELTALDVYHRNYAHELRATAPFHDRLRSQ